MGLDHRLLEIEVRVEGWRVEEEGWKKEKVDWGKFEAELRVWKGKGLWLKKGMVTRENLEMVVKEVEKSLKERLDRCKGMKKLESGRRRWWDSELEEKRKRGRYWEERWKESRSEEVKEERRVEREK